MTPPAEEESKAAEGNVLPDKGGGAKLFDAIDALGKIDATDESFKYDWDTTGTGVTLKANIQAIWDGKNWYFFFFF